MFIVIGVIVLLPFISCSEDKVSDPGDSEDKFPLVMITKPMDGSSVTDCDTIDFAGSGEDYKGNEL